MAYAGYHARLNAPRSDGSTERDHWTAIQKRGPVGRNAKLYQRAVARLAGPSFPVGLGRTWALYLDCRQLFPGVECLTLREVRAYGAEMGVAIEPWQTRLVVQLDAHVRKESQPKKPAEPPATTPTPHPKTQRVQRGQRERSNVSDPT